MNRTNLTFRLCLAHFLTSIIFPSQNASGTNLAEKEIYSYYHLLIPFLIYCSKTFSSNGTFPNPVT